MRTISTAFCLLISAISLVKGQDFAADTAFVAIAQSNAINLYTARLGVLSNVYNGNEYAEYRPQREEHPYLITDWIYGSVDYAGEHYESIPLMLDLSTDQLITVYTSGNAIQMIREKVRSFQLENRFFVSIKNDQVPTSFYELVYDGNVKFYIRRQKTLLVRLNGTELQNTFEESTNYYLVKDGKFHSFRSRRGVLKVLADRKSELKKYMHENKIFFEDREASTVRVLSYYDQITR